MIFLKYIFERHFGSLLWDEILYSHHKWVQKKGKSSICDSDELKDTHVYARHFISVSWTEFPSVMLYRVTNVLITKQMIVQFQVCSFIGLKL